MKTPPNKFAAYAATAYKVGRSAKYVWDRLPSSAKKAIKRKITFSSPQKRKKAKNTPSPARYRRAGGYNPLGRNKGGKYYGRFGGVPKRKQPNRKLRQGIVFKSEFGGTQACAMDHTVYVGHSIATKILLQTIVRSMIKKLLTNAGFSVQNWNQTVLQTIPGLGTDFAEIGTRYRKHDDPESAITEFGFSFSPGTSLETVANTWLTDFRTSLGAGGGVGNLSQYNIQLYSLTLNQVRDAKSIALGTLVCKDLHVDTGYYSNLVLQNRTNDAAGSGSILATTNNPVHGRIYESRAKWRNGFDLAQATQSTILFAQNFYAQNAKGMIVADSTETQTAILQKPPRGWYFGTKRDKAVLMQPGEIRKLQHKWSAKMRLNTILSKLWKNIYNNPGDSAAFAVELGFAQLVGLECQLFDRTETNELQISYELNQTYFATLTYKQPRTPAIINIDTTPVGPGDP